MIPLLRHIAAVSILLLVFGCVTTGNDPDGLEQDLASLRQRLNQGGEVSTIPLLPIIDSETSTPLLKARAAYLAARILAQEEATPSALEMAVRSLELYEHAKGTVSITWHEVSMPLDIALMVETRLSGPEASLPLAKKYGRPIDQKSTTAWSRKPGGVILHNPTRITVPGVVGRLKLFQKTTYDGEEDSFGLHYYGQHGSASVDYMPVNDSPLEDYARHELLVKSLSTFAETEPILRRLGKGEVKGIKFPGFLVRRETMTGATKLPGHSGTLILDVGTHMLRVRYAFLDSQENQQGADLDILAAIVSAIRWPAETGG